MPLSSPPAYLEGTAASAADARAGTDTSKYLTPAAGNARALHGSLTRALRDSLFSDGFTSSRRVEWTPGTAGAVAALPVSIPFEFQVPTSNPSATARVWDITSNNTAPSVPGNRMTCVMLTTGALVVNATGTTSGTDVRDFTWSAFRSTYSGQYVRGFVVFSAPDTTTSPTVYVNGVDVTANFTLTTGGTPPNWVSGSLTTTYFVSSYGWTAGRFVPHAPILGALTAAEVLEWTQTGRLPTWCEIGTGSAAASSYVNGSFEDDVASPPASWSNNGNHVGTAVADGTAPSGSNVMEVVASGAGNATNYAGRSKLATIIGRRYVYEFWAKSISGNTALTFEPGGGDIDPVTTAAPQVTLTAAWVRYVVVAHCVSSASGSTRIFLAGAGTFRIDNIRRYDLGPIFKPVIQPIAVVADAGSNKLAGILTSGITPITEKRDWVIQGSTNTNGNQQLLGASVFFDSTRHVIDDWCMNTAGTPTVTAGSASAGTQYKASGALAAARNLITLATRVLASANLWCGSNDTSTIYHTVRGHIVD